MSNDNSFLKGFGVGCGLLAAIVLFLAITTTISCGGLGVLFGLGNKVSQDIERKEQQQLKREEEARKAQEEAERKGDIAPDVPPGEPAPDSP